MRVIQIKSEDNVAEHTFSFNQGLTQLHKFAERYLGAAHDGKVYPTDMDGVLIFDDLAITAADIAFSNGSAFFGQVADLNIKARDEGVLPYCWNAPTAFVGRLVKGLSPEVNTVIGKHMRLIPRTKDYIGALQELGYDITVVTAGHQEGAQEVGRRLGIENVIGTQLGVADGIYTGEIDRFIGGKWKLAQVEKLLGNPVQGVHVGDSWSDVETLEGIENSVAFNPGCHYALQHARISLISPNKLALLPFFDYQGRFDSKLCPEVFDDVTVIINESHHPVESHQLSAKILEESKAMKKQIGEYLNAQDCKNRVLPVQTRILGELQERGIIYTSSLQDLPNPEEFHTEAVTMYRDMEYRIVESHR